MFIGRYRVIRELAQGGMARVTLAVAPSGRRVVIKRPLRDDDDAYDRLLDEAQAGARLTHSNIVETLDFFREDGVPHLVLGYVEGRTLLEVRQDGPLDAAVVVRIGRQMAEALSAMHTATDGEGEPLRMLHRDISGSNIVLSANGDAHLIDLGIVRSAESVSQRTRQGFLRGKICYLSPELFFGRTYSTASDLWALGMVLFEAAVGRRALEGSQPEVTARIVSGDVMELREGEVLDARLESALRRLLCTDPDQRTAQAKETMALFRMLELEFDDAAAAERAAEAGRGFAPPKILGTVIEESGDVIEVASADIAPLLATGLEATWRERRSTALSEELHEASTTLFRAPGSSTLLLPAATEAPMSPRERLLHYVAELQSLTSAPSGDADAMGGMPPEFDPWQMDSSPGR